MKPFEIDVNEGEILEISSLGVQTEYMLVDANAKELNIVLEKKQ